MKHELVKLNNGLRTIFIDNPGSTFATVQIWFSAGSALEAKGEEGIAHFLEHMFFKGTKTRPGPQIAHEVESFGGEVNAFTSFDYTCYYINSPKTNILESTEILMDMVSNPLFKNIDIIPEREVVLEEYKRSLDTPSQYSFQCLQKNSFQAGYAHPILGNQKTIKNFSRQQLISFRKRYYNNKNAVLLIAGDLAKIKSKLVTKIESFKLPNGNQSVFPSFKLKKTQTINIHSKDVELAQLSLAISSPPLEDHHASAEDLAINCLGYGESSRLYKNLVRDNALANSASSSTMFMSHGGVHFIKFYFPIKNLEEILTKFEKTIANIYENGFQENEINKIKNQYVASKTFDLESLETFAFSIGNGFVQTGDLESESKFIDRIKLHSLKEVNKSFKEIFARPMHISYQTPKGEKKAPSEKLLKNFLLRINKITNATAQPLRRGLKVEKSSFDPAVKILTLKPGIKLLYRQNSITPTYTLHSYIKGGLTDETLQNNGYHNLLASCITKGYDKISEDTINEDLENTSTSLSGFAGKNAYGITMHGLTNKIDEMLEHFFGSLIEPTFKQQTFSRIKTLTLRSIVNQKKDPIRTIFNEANKLMFGDHPYSYNSLGTSKTLKSLTAKKVLDFHLESLKQKELLFTYCGDLTLDELMNILSPHVDKLAARKTLKPQHKVMQPITNKLSHIKLEREQTHIFIGFPSKEIKEKENLYLKILSAHLSGQSSKLFVEVRDRQGLCYTAQPIHFMGLEGGYWGIYIACGNDKTTSAITAIEEILEETLQTGLTLKEFKTVKKNIEGQTLLNVQTNEDFASLYSIPLLQGFGVDHFHKTNLQIEKLTHEKFKTEVKKLKKRSWKTIIVGS